MTWNATKLAQIARLGDGAHASIKRTEFGVPYLTSKNFKSEGLNTAKLDYISESDYKHHFKADSSALTKPQKGDLLVGIIGTLGAPYLVKETDRFGLSSSVAIIRPDSRILDSRFLYYFIKSKHFQNSIHQIKSGVAQSFLSLGMIGNVIIKYPPLLIQEKIAETLSSYDDLIENNLQRIRLLEEMAQLTYEEWFVRMRFRDESDLDKNWLGFHSKHAKHTLGDFIKFQKGKKASEVFSESGENLKKIMLLDSLESGEFKYTDSRGHVTTRRGDILMCMDGARSSHVFRAEDGIVGSTMAKINVERVPVSLVFYALKSKIGDLKSNNTGAAIPHANKKYILNIDFELPTEQLISRWLKFISPIESELWNLADQNRLLREARDILLPRLMNGEIDPDEYAPDKILDDAA